MTEKIYREDFSLIASEEASIKGPFISLSRSSTIVLRTITHLFNYLFSIISYPPSPNLRAFHLQYITCVATAVYIVDRILFCAWISLLQKGGCQLNGSFQQYSCRRPLGSRLNGCVGLFRRASQGFA